MNFKKAIKRLGGDLIYRMIPGRAEYDRVVTLPEFHNLGPGDVAIDCGANLGAITSVLAAGGAEVHAFEPNPDAFRILSSKVKHLPNVHLHQKAVLDKPGFLTLYLHMNYGRNPERFSSGSSLIAEKRNVDDRSGIDVEVIDFPAFVRSLNRPIKLLKVDIEGAEYVLLNALIDAGLMDRIEKIYVETHAHAIPSLQEADTALRLRLKTLGLEEKIDLNWI